MLHNSSPRNLFAIILLLLISACAQNTPILDQSALPQLTNIRSPADNVVSSGQPTEEEFRQLAAAGVKHIINLRPATEQADFDEGALVRSLGMEYHHLPIAGGADVTASNARTLDQLLTELDGQPVVAHCASGNRVGALRAMTALESGMSVDAALAEGERWGLTGMAPAVRTILSNQAGQ